jgi:hypothetical protein
MFILFKGDLLDETQQVDVIAKFGALFGVSPQEAAPFFKRHAVFFRNKLDSFTAQRYYRRLTGIGVKVFLGSESSVALDGPDAAALQSLPVSTCPICHTNQVFDKKCVICNQNDLKKVPVQPVASPHYHPRGAASAFIEGSESGPGHTPHELKEHAEKARKALWIGCLLMLVALIFDDSLTNYAMFEAVALWKKNTLDMGIIPYLVATLIITYGCLHYARLKGYPSGFGLLGLTNLFGLGILILLPARRQPQVEKPYLNATRISSMLMIVFCLWWAAGFFGKQKDSGSFLSKPVPFLIELYEPKLNVDDSIPATQDALLEREEYLQAYINEAFDLLLTHEFDVDTTARIADGLYAGISNMSIWLYYQHFLYRTHDRKIPLCFRQDEIEAKIRVYINDVISRNEQLQNDIVTRTHKDWTMFYAREDDPDLQEIDEFRRKLLTLVYKPIVFPWDPEEREKDITERVSNALHGFDPAEELFDVEFQTDSRQLWILLKPDLVEPLAGKTVCFGLWEKPGAVRWSHKKGSYRKTVTVFKRIGGDLPGKYLHPDIGNALARAAFQIAAGDFDPQQ